MDDLHRLLARQISRSGLDLTSTKEGKILLETINKTYKQFERERKILEVNAKRMLEKISRANENLHTIISTLDGFNYHVSHDLKTSMINAVGLSKMINKYVETDNKEKVLEVVDKLMKNSYQGLDLIEKFLQISKFDTHLSEQGLGEVNIPEVVEHILKDLNLIGKFKLRFTKTDFDTLMAKEVGIRSLFQNLITNAYKYKKSDVELEVDIQMVLEGNNRIIRFKDNGIGIDLKRNEKKLFKPFVRIANNTNEEGNGVGLFLVKKVVSEHNGSIHVISEPEKGTEFILTF